MHFSDFGLNAALLRGVEDLGFTSPTPIQSQSIPAGLEGRDLLAAAMTGSGKTAAFLLPVLHRLLAKPRGTTRALVLTPTRELAAQIHEHLELLARHTALKGAAVFGGVPMGAQERAFRSGVDVVIATPGRLLDHLRSNTPRFENLEVLVLDEADRMLDMGFLPDVRRVLSFLPKKRQTLFFSATMPTEIQRLSKEMLVNPVAFNIERKAAPATGVTQKVFAVSAEGKSALLLELLNRGELGSVIVFTRTKHRTNRLSDFLDRHGVKNARIHGNRSQAQRIDALAAFKAGKIRVLCATDIVAPGIDVEQLEHVVNFDVPHVPEDYIHRVGRTARAEATGEAFTFVCRDEESDLIAIERAIGKKLERVTLPDFDYNARPAERLEIPIGERIAAIRAKKQEDRARAQQKADRRGGNAGGGGGFYSGEGPRAGGAPAPTNYRTGRNNPNSRGGGPGGWRGGGAQGTRDAGAGGAWGSSSPGRSPAGGWGGNDSLRDRADAAPRPSREDAVEVSPGIWRRKP